MQLLKDLFTFNIASNMMKTASNKDKSDTLGIDDLEKLAELKQKGVISEEDFNAKKKQILGI